MISVQLLDHQVLALLSKGYACLDGRLLMCYAPVYRSPAKAGSLDLHALDTPPAFILSQDQTLSKKDLV